jgi:hypothetical protein
MALKENFNELIKNLVDDYSDQNVTALNSFLQKHSIRFNTYYNLPNGQNAVKATYNYSGKFDYFEQNSYYPYGTLMFVNMDGKNVYVQTSDIFFDEKY